MTTELDTKQELIIPYSSFYPNLDHLHTKYIQAEPYPHIALDDFLIPQAAEDALNEFPPFDSKTWIHYVHVNEKKFGKTDLSTIGKKLCNIIEELNSEKFVEFLSQLTGIKGLFADPSLEGGGLHQTGRGGFLNMHADFTGHPHHPTWRRRVNVLVYLNKNWETKYHGHLELWDRTMKRRIRKIAPTFNRCVIFSTDKDTFHGHPIPLACPKNMTRKSIALYYFTKEHKKFAVKSTEYRSRPHDTIHRVWIYLDKVILRCYDFTKRRLGINDKAVSRMLGFFHQIRESISDIKGKISKKKHKKL